MKTLLLGDEAHGRIMEAPCDRDLIFAGEPENGWPDLRKPCDPDYVVTERDMFRELRYRFSQRLSTRAMQVMVSNGTGPESDKAVELMHNLALSGSAEPTGLVINGLPIYIASHEYREHTSRAIETLRKAIKVSGQVFWQAVRETIDELRNE